MKKITIDNFQNNMNCYIDDVVKNNHRIAISTHKGSAILLSENDFLELQGILGLYSPSMIKKITSGEKELLDSLSTYSPSNAW
ncbi:MAG: type II toxin-antitoxin system Phd/YefM family antitoxin [Clostridiales bacterium]|nr:type II toxin-antitoxin system Phd/YefM family antitoxin [Clostridiales bacterium]